MVISTLKAATRKRTPEVRSNSHTGQYAGSISPDHSQGKTLVEPLEYAVSISPDHSQGKTLVEPLAPGVARHINKFLRKTSPENL